MKKLRTIYLAGGCFWGLEKFMENITGVVETRVGYANGKNLLIKRSALAVPALRRP